MNTGMPHRPLHASALWRMAGTSMIILVLAAVAHAAPPVGAPTARVAPVPSGALAAMHIERIENQGFPRIACIVSVADDAGGTLAGLTADSFTVTEDGRAIEGFRVSATSVNDERVAVVLVVDCSGSMSGAPLAAARAAAQDFIRRLATGDALSVVTFAGRVAPSQEVTADRGPALAALDSLRPRGKTALYDAIAQALDLLSERPAERRAVIALTDGNDNASAATAADCVRAAAGSDVSIYCVGLGRSVDTAALTVIAEETGGRCFLTRSPEGLTGIYRRIARDIKSRYTITYDAPHPDQALIWRNVEVRVRDRGRQAADRRDYLAPGRGGQPAQTLTALPGGVYLVLLCLAVLDGGLAYVLVRRRRARWVSRAGRRRR